LNGGGVVVVFSFVLMKNYLFFCFVFFFVFLFRRWVAGLLGCWVAGSLGCWVAGFKDFSIQQPFLRAFCVRWIVL
jgi:hypothetical protein